LLGARICGLLACSRASDGPFKRLGSGATGVAFVPGSRVAHS